MNNEDVTTQDVFENLQELLDHNAIREFREAFLDHHIYDQTQFYLDFTDEERLELYSIYHLRNCQRFLRILILMRSI